MIIHASVIIQSEKNERINVPFIVDGVDCIGWYYFGGINIIMNIGIVIVWLVLLMRDRLVMMMTIVVMII